MRVLVSACIMGDRCKYNGQSNRNELAIEYLRDKDVVKICPEMLAGMGIPRPCAEIVEGIVMDEHGENVDDTYRRAVELALKTIENQPFDLVILQSRSPTCGVNEVYDGSFTGRLVPGSGLFAKALKDAGYRILDVSDLEGFSEQA
ncbi:MAG: DUF523 domain-containing protein [Sphaerochaetaceae bacterium]|jgi:uncharacterized protein YbbK (DUF523 family)